MGSDPIIDPTARDLSDLGLWTIDDNLRIQVAKSDIAESILPGGSHFKLADLDGRQLSFAPQATLRPDPTHLAWQRVRCLQALPEGRWDVGLLSLRAQILDCLAGEKSKGGQ